MLCGQIINSIKKDLDILFKCNNKDLFTQVRTPFVYPDGDYINIYVMRNFDQIIITDAGETFANLSLFGIDIRRSKKRSYILNEVLKNQKVYLKEGELYVIIDNNDLNFYNHLSMGIMRLGQAISRISDIIFTQEKPRKNFFVNNVSNFLKEKTINYEMNYKLKGISENEFVFDFYIKHGKTHKIIKTLSADNCYSANSMITNSFRAFYEIKRTNNVLKRIALIDDSKDVWEDSWFDLLSEVSLVTNFSDKDRLLELLCA